MFFTSTHVLLIGMAMNIIGFILVMLPLLYIKADWKNRSLYPGSDPVGQWLAETKYISILGFDFVICGFILQFFSYFKI